MLDRIGKVCVRCFAAALPPSDLLELVCTFRVSKFQVDESSDTTRDLFVNE